MSVRNARKFFEENLRRHIDPVRDPQIHNLNAGLVQLVDGLANELERMREELSYVSAQVAELTDRLEFQRPRTRPLD